MQVGLLDAAANRSLVPVAEGIYIMAISWIPVEWANTARMSPAAGRPVQIVIRMRGARLYALHFVAE
jgi:hypothetical protein